MKHYLLAACLLITMPVFCQLSAGGSLGLSSITDFCSIKLQYEIRNKVGISTSMFAHMDNHNPAYFNTEVFTPLRIDRNFRVVPHAGYSYKIKSLDNKELNNGAFIYGIDIEHGISQRATIMFGFSQIYDKHTETTYVYNNRYELQSSFTITKIERPVFFSLGIRFSFGQLVDDCQ